MDIDLSQLSNAELKDLELKIEAARSQRQQAALDAIVKETQHKLLAAGLTWADLPRKAGSTKPKAKAKRTVVPPKYRHPQNARITWSGRGRKPAWVQTHLDGGGKLDELLIAGPKSAARPAAKARLAKPAAARAKTVKKPAGRRKASTKAKSGKATTKKSATAKRAAKKSAAKTSVKSSSAKPGANGAAAATP